MTKREIPASDVLIGTVLQEAYAIDRRVAQGGMSHIYEAHHLRLEGRRFAVKVLLAELSENAELRGRFRREINAVASIDHPGVVRVYDSGITSQGWPFMVNELLVGMDLATWLRTFGPLPVETALYVGRQLAHALTAMHAGGVIHRDLKPSNVFFVGDFRDGPPARPGVKVLDFGLSRFLDRDDGLTKTQLVLGTPSYMSPEQARGERGDRLSDVYGLGAVLYASVTGKPPFDGPTPAKTVLSVLRRRAVRPRKLRPEMPEGLEVVIQSCMAKDPKQRYRDTDQVARALSNLAGDPTPETLRRREREALVDSPWPLRLQLSGLLLGAFAWLAGNLALATRGALELSSSALELTPATAVVLGLAGAAGTALALKVALHLHREVWPNSARLVSWTLTLRTTLGGGVVAYGVAALLSRACRWAAVEGYTWFSADHVRDLDWAGYDVLFAGVSLTWSAAVIVGRCAPGSARRGARLDPTLAAAATLISVGAFAWVWGATSLPDVAVARLGGSAARTEVDASAPARAQPGNTPAEAPPVLLPPGPDAGPPISASSTVIDLDAPPDAATIE